MISTSTTRLRILPRRPRFITGGLLALALVLAAGCGERPPRLVPVTGSVMMDGKPLTAGSIIFYPDDENEYVDDNPSALLQLDGSFVMKTFPFGEGVAPGRYKVTLAPELAKRISRPQYENSHDSPWEIDVPDDGVSDHVFEVQ